MIILVFAHNNKNWSLVIIQLSSNSLSQILEKHVPFSWSGFHCWSIVSTQYLSWLTSLISTWRSGQIRSWWLCQCDNLFLHLYFPFLNEALRVPIHLGLPLTQKVYCSYVAMLDNKNIRGSFLMIHLLKKSIYIHTNKRIYTNMEQHKITKTKTNYSWS